MYRCVFFLLLAPLVYGQEAPMVVLPPAKDLQAELNAFPQETLREYLALDFPHQSFNVFAGRNADLEREQEQPGGTLEVGAGLDLALDAHNLFQKPLIEGGTRIWLAALQSVDAHALRLQFDLSGLAAGEELWVVDPNTPRAFGPFQAGDQEGNTLWSPTIGGDTAVLMLRSAQETLPPLRVERLSHFFRSLAPSAEKCPIDVRCETDPDILAASTAIGRLLLTTTSGGTLLCTGSLVAASGADTSGNYFISANHCFPASVEVGSAEVIWDYKRSACDGEAPTLGSLPRSQGASMLATSTTLDFAFLQLGSVPSGADGRAFLGWTQVKAVVGDQVLGMHHPGGRPMTICYGHVTQTDRSDIFYRLQNEFQWDEGITEKGSSGSPALYADSLLLMGVLSNGATHVCGRPEGNIDNYSSFREFFPVVACYLDSGQDCAEPPSLCPAKVAFGENSTTVAALRGFRDDVLTKSTWGRAIIQDYYRRAPQLAEAVGRSNDARNFFCALALPAALYEQLTEN